MNRNAIPAQRSAASSALIPHPSRIAAINISASLGLRATDRCLDVMPLFHVHGLVASTLATLLTGGTVVVPSRFNPLSFWRTVRDSRATWYSAVPTMHQLLLARLGRGSEKPAGAEFLRFIRSCSAPLPVEAVSTPPTREKRQIYFVDRPSSVQSTIVVGALAVPRKSPDYIALRTANILAYDGAPVHSEQRLML